MAREVFVALYRNLDDAESARRALEQDGVSVEDIDLRSHDLIGFAAAEVAPPKGGLWEDLFAAEPQYRQHLDSGGALLAVRSDGSEYDRVATVLLRHHPATRPMLQDKTSQSTHVRRYTISGEDRVPLHQEAISLRAKA
jgi:hypothetical protein